RVNAGASAHVVRQPLAPGVEQSAGAGAGRHLAGLDARPRLGGRTRMAAPRPFHRQRAAGIGLAIGREQRAEDERDDGEQRQKTARRAHGLGLWSGMSLVLGLLLRLYWLLHSE